MSLLKVREGKYRWKAGKQREHGSFVQVLLKLMLTYGEGQNQVIPTQ
jgi:hypothetical protein